jgi:hypothetical protein
MRPLSAEETIAQTKSHALTGVGALSRLGAAARPAWQTAILLYKPV